MSFRLWAASCVALAVIGSGSPAVVALPLQVAPAQAVECPDNLLVSPGFENGFAARQRPSEIVANGWSAWYKYLPGVDGINYVPDYSPRRRDVDGFATVLSGLWSQEMATQNATHLAGIWQRVYVPPDSQIQASIWAYAWASNGDDPGRSEPPGTYALALGIDPRGGDDADSARITWTAPVTITDAWLPLSLAAPVAGPVITLFTRGQPLQLLAHNVSRWDGACLRVIGRAGEPPFTATPVPWPTRTPTPGTPTAAPNRATREAVAMYRALVLAATATARAATAGPDAGATTEAGLAQLPAERPFAMTDVDLIDIAGLPPEPSLVEAIADHLGLVSLVLAAFVAGLTIGLGRITR